MRYQKVYTSFWRDEKVVRLGEDARTLFLYLMTSPHGNILGAFVCPVAYMASDLRWSAERVNTALEELVERRLVGHDPSVDIVVVARQLRWNELDNPNKVKHAIKTLESLPRGEYDVVFDLIIYTLEASENPDRYRPLLDRLKQRIQSEPTLGEGFRKGSERVPKGLAKGSESLSKPETETETITAKSKPPSSSSSSTPAYNYDDDDEVLERKQSNKTKALQSSVQLQPQESKSTTKKKKRGRARKRRDGLDDLVDIFAAEYRYVKGVPYQVRDREKLRGQAQRIFEYMKQFDDLDTAGALQMHRAMVNAYLLETDSHDPKNRLILENNHGFGNYVTALSRWAAESLEVLVIRQPSDILAVRNVMAMNPKNAVQVKMMRERMPDRVDEINETHRQALERERKEKRDEEAS